MPPQTPSGSGSFDGIDRVVRDRPRGLSVEDVEAKDRGKYLLSFGLTGSGKTTLQWMLVNFLMSEGAYRTTIETPDRPDGGTDREGRRIIDDR